MDHFDILKEMQNGKFLEIMSQTIDSPIAKAYIDGIEVSVSQAVRASNSPNVVQVSKCSEWSLYKAV